MIEINNSSLRQVQRVRNSTYHVNHHSLAGFLSCIPLFDQCKVYGLILWLRISALLWPVEAIWVSSICISMYEFNQILRCSCFSYLSQDSNSGNKFRAISSIALSNLYLPHLWSTSSKMQIGVFIPIGNNGQVFLPLHQNYHLLRRLQLAHFHQLAPIQAQLRTKQTSRPKSRKIRLGLRPLHDQTPWFWRQDRILGSQSRVLYFNGRSRCRHHKDKAICLNSYLDFASSNSSTNGHNNQFHCPRKIRDQYRYWMARSRIQSNGHLARKRLFWIPIRLCNRIRASYERALG